MPSRSIALVAMLSGLAGAALAEEAPGNPQDRTLGGHRFLASAQVHSPFLTTHFRNSLGFSSASDVEFPFVVIDSIVLVSLSGDYLFVTANLGYQHVVHPRVAVFVDAEGASRVGTNFDALIAQGVSALSGYGAGALVEVWRGDRVLLSTAARVGHGEVLAVDFISFALDVLAGRWEDASVVQTSGGTTLDIQVRGAFAMNRWSGFMFDGGAGIDDFGPREGELRWSTSASYGMDFGQRDGWPIGVVVAGEITQLSLQAFEADRNMSVGLGLQYTGRTDFQVGLESTWGAQKLKDTDIAIDRQSHRFALRYFF